MAFGSGVTVNSFTVNSSTQITASITISSTATVGSRNVSVTTPAGTATMTDGFTVNTSSPKVNLEVPFITQVPPGSWGTTKNCGQTSSLMVFCYWNSTTPTTDDIKAIDDWLYQNYGDPIDNYNGYFTDHTKLKLEALAQGYGSFIYSYETDKWDLARVKQEIDGGRPVIVAIAGELTGNYIGDDDAWHTTDRDYSTNGHWLVVKGYSDTDVICNDPGTSHGHNIYYDNDEFSNAMWGWSDTSGWDGAVCVVVPSPVADAGLDQSVSSGDVVSFHGSDSHDPNGTIVSYQWDFGDGITQTGEDVSHRFRGATNEPKTYVITLTVEDSNGTTSTDTCEVIVNPLQKIVEVTHDPLIPVPGQPVFARMTVLYNWIHDDTYMVSQIHYESEGFTGVGTISIWDYYSSVVPIPRWAANIFTLKGDEEETYYPKLEQVLYGGDTFEGIKVDAFDVMSIYIEGWAGISISIGPSIPVPFFEVNSACFQPDYTGASDVPIEALDLDLTHLCSPGELRVYDSQGRVTGLVNGEIKNEIPESSYYEGTVLILSPDDLYQYEVAGTDSGSYGLVVASLIQGETNTFTATDIPLTLGTTHRYSVDWESLSQGEDAVTVQVDSDGDGIFESTITSDSELTGDEFTATQKTSGLPIWIWFAVGGGVIIVVILGILVRRRLARKKA